MNKKTPSYGWSAGGGKKVICIGSSGRDIFFPTSEGMISETPDEIASQRKITFELGAKYHIDDRFETLGGCAVNVAIGLSRLGLPVACYTMIGDDLSGEWIKKETEKEGVDMGLVMTEEKCLSGLSAIIVDDKSGERTIFSNQEPNERLKVIPEKLMFAEWISVSDLTGEWQKKMTEIFSAAENAGAKIAFNPRGKNIKDDAQKVSEMAGKAEIFFVNKDEAIEILMTRAEQLETQDAAYIIKELKKTGAKVVVVTDGQKGAWAYDGERLVWAAAANKNPKETTGAGDAFSSGFLAAHIKGKNLEECLRWGTANAGNSVNFYGGVQGLLTEQEMAEKAQACEVKFL